MAQTPAAIARHELRNLEQLLDHIEEAARDQERVSLDRIITAVGRRSFAPMLLLVGTLLMSPLSGIPGFPTTLAAFILLVALQLLVGRKHFWLPRWLLNRSVSESKLVGTLKWLRRPAIIIDRAIKPRLTFLVRGPGQYAIALICTLIALGVPFMEIVPFLATAAGVALMIFGLALVSYDGALVLGAFLITAVVVGLVLYTAM